jgi:hypothetical protein
MFYRQEDIDQDFVCKLCTNIYVDPRLLPCSESACHDCIQRMIGSNLNNEFDCKLCQGKHKSPGNEGFLLNGFLSNLLRTKPGNVYRSAEIKELTDKLADLKSKCEEFKFSLYNGVEQVREQCIQLRNQVHLETDILLEEVHKFNEDLIAEIDKYEQECVDSFNRTVSKEDNEFDKFLVGLNKFHLDKTKYLAEFDVDEKVVEEALAKADVHLKQFKFVYRSLKKIQFNGKLAEYIKSQHKIERALLGTFVFKSLNFDVSKLNQMKFNSNITKNYGSFMNLFVNEYALNYVFYIDSFQTLTMCSFDNDGKIVKQVADALEYNRNFEYSRLNEYKVVQSQNKFIVFVRRKKAYLDGAICGHKITNDEFIIGLFFMIDHNFNYLRHSCIIHDNFNSKSIQHMAANSSTILWVNTDFKYSYLDMNLALLNDKPLDAITTQVGNTIVDVQMNDKYAFFLCNDKKLKIFEIDSGHFVKEIKTSADQIKLTPVDRLVLFDSVNRVVYFYDQSVEFCKLNEVYLGGSIEADLLINRDQSNCLAFFNSKSMTYISMDSINDSTI